MFCCVIRMSLRVDRIPDLGLHGFLRYALPGYAFWTVLFIPAIFDYKNFKESIPLFSDYFGPTVIVLSGPILGFIFFHIYYILFERLYLRTAFWHQAMHRHFNRRLCRLSESEYRLRALYDLVFYDKRNVWKDRIDYLFSSFHSLAACSLAIWFAFVAWLFYGQIGLIISHALWLEGYVSLVIVTSILTYHYLDRYYLARSEEEMVVLRNLFRIDRYLGLLENEFFTQNREIKRSRLGPWFRVNSHLLLLVTIGLSWSSPWFFSVSIPSRLSSRLGWALCKGRVQHAWILGICLWGGLASNVWCRRAWMIEDRLQFEGIRSQHIPRAYETGSFNSLANEISLSWESIESNIIFLRS